jgi:hypothetical protein
MVVVIGCWWIGLLLHRRHVPRVDGVIPTRDELLAILYRGCHPATTGRDNEETVPPGNGIKSTTEIVDATAPAETIVTMDVAMNQKTTIGMVVVVAAATMVQAVMAIRIDSNPVVVEGDSSRRHLMAVICHCTQECSERRISYL